MRVEGKEVAINTVDFTSLFARVGYEVTYVKRVGGNAGMMQDGTMEEDLITRKAVVKLPCLPLTEDQISEVLTETFREDYPLFRYFDPWRKAYRLVQTIADTETVKYRGAGASGDEYWTGVVITFTEK